MLSQRPGAFPSSYRTYGGSALTALALTLSLLSVWQDLGSPGNGRAAIAAIVIWLWLTMLVISIAHVWQGVSKSFFGAFSVITGLSATLSGFWLLVFYPAVMSMDAIWQWRQALRHTYSLWHPPAMAMLMHVTQCCSQSPSLFSFIQGLLFWGFMFCLIRQVAGGDRRFLVLCGVMMVVPPLWLYSNAAVSNTWTAAFMMLSAAFLIGSIRTKASRLLIGAVLALSVAIMFRRETAIIVPVLIAAYLWRFGRHRGVSRAGCDILLIVAVVWLPAALVAASPHVMKIDDYRPAQQGLLNYYVGIVAHSRPSMTDTKIERERQSVDRTFGPGTFQGLLDRYVCYSSSFIGWRRDELPPAAQRWAMMKNSFGTAQLARIAVRHPLGLIEHQMCYVAYLTQFAALDYQDWGTIDKNRNLNQLREKMDIPVESRLPWIKDQYSRLMKALLRHPALSLIVRHYVFLIAAAVALVVGLRTRRVELIIPSLFSLVYPVAFVIAGPSTPWRYLLPSYVLSWISILPLASDFVGRGAVDGSSSGKSRTRNEEPRTKN